MKLEEIKNKTKDAVDYLVASLEAGHREVLTQCHWSHGEIPHLQLWQRHAYARQKPSATNVAGVLAWNSLGRFVRRGQKGIFILAPLVGRKGKILRIDHRGEGRGEKPASAAVRLPCCVCLRHLADRRQRPSRVDRSAGRCLGYREWLVKFVEAQSIELRYSDKIGPARGLSQGGKITLLSGMQPAEEFSTLVHEIGHLCGAEVYVR